MRPITKNPCKRCGKYPRYDYDGYCTDCVDELGFTEFAYLEKAFNKGIITKKEYRKKLQDLLSREPILVIEEGGEK